MDNNNDDGSWMYSSDQWVDSSLFHPASDDDDEPMIELMEGTETPAASSDLVEGERPFIAFPSTPPSLPPPPSIPLNNSVIARPQYSPPPATASGSRQPSGIRKAIRKTKKKKPIPKYMWNLDGPRLTEKERKCILHAIKCRNERLRKRGEMVILMENHNRVVNQFAMMMEQLQAEKEKIKALEQEIERQGHVILELSVNESPA